MRPWPANASLDQFAYGGLRFAQRRRQDHPVDASGDAPPCGFGIQVVPVVDDQLDGGTGGDAQQAHQQFAQVGAAGVGECSGSELAARLGV